MAIMPFVPDTAPQRKSRFVSDAPKTATDLPPIPDTPLPPAPKPAEQRHPMDTRGETFSESFDRFPGRVGELLKGAGETALSGITGTIASAANLANQLTGVNHLLKEDNETPAQYQARMREAYTYQPRSAVGKDLADIAGKTVGRVIEEGSNYAGEKTGDLEVAEFLKDVSAVAPAAGALKKVAKAPQPAAVYDGKPRVTDARSNLIPEDPKRRLREAGFVFRESDRRGMEPSVVNNKANLAEKVAGSEELGKDMTTRNQVLATRLAGKGAGFGDKITAITPKMLEKGRTPHIAKYEEVGQTVGKFRSSDAFRKALGTRPHS
jgi:hypothetical protein